MGTSGSFKGSGGSDAASLRGAISDWLNDPSADSSPDTESATDNNPATPPTVRQLDPSRLAPILRLWNRGGSGGSNGGGSGSGSSSSGGSAPSVGRSSGGPQRTVGRVAGPAGRASSIIRAYVSGDRQTVEAAGLNYDELRSLNDPLEVGRRIVSVAFDTQPDGSIEDSESRLIVAELVSWMMEAPHEAPRQPDDVVRRSIELMILQATLSEVGSTVREEKNATKRRLIEAEIRTAARVLASKVELNAVEASSASISLAIKNGVVRLLEIYGGAN